MNTVEGTTKHSNLAYSILLVMGADVILSPDLRHLRKITPSKQRTREQILSPSMHFYGNAPDLHEELAGNSTDLSALLSPDGHYTIQHALVVPQLQSLFHHVHRGHDGVVEHGSCRSCDRCPGGVMPWLVDPQKCLIKNMNGTKMG